MRVEKPLSVYWGEKSTQGAKTMLSRNQYPGKCNSPVCNVKVEAGAGYRQQINGRWVVWCSQCVPQRIVPTKEVQRELSAHGEIRMPYEPENLPIIRAMPGARWNPDSKFWTVSTDDADRKRVLELADRIGLKVAEEFRAIALAEPAQNAICAGLYGFQVEGVNWLSKQTAALLGDEMGLGKSVQALMSLPSDGYGLIVVPAGLKYNWESECKKWRDDLVCTVLNGENAFRWPRKNEVVIMSYNTLPNWLITPKKPKGQSNKEYYASITQWQKGLQEKYPVSLETTLIVDEVHNVKNYKTQKSQKVKNLARITKRVWGLTGTPLINRPIDLYTILDGLNMAYKAFGGLPRFRTLFNAFQDRFGWHYGQPMSIVPELLRRVMLRRLRKEVLPDLPDKTYTTLVVDLENGSLSHELNSLWEEYGEMIEVAEELPPFEEFSKIRYELAKSRIPAMLEYVENAEEQDVPLVVFSSHLPPLDALLVREGWAVISGDTPPHRRQEIVRDFQDGKLKGVGVSIKAGGVGLTLTRAWKALFVDLDWTPAANTQAEDRLCILRGQMIHTRRGFLPIEQVVIGDEVFTHKGNWKKVLNIHNREHRKLITNIKYTRYAADCLSTTHDHEILIKRQKGSIEWCKSCEVLPGDFLVFPRDKTSTDVDFIEYPMEQRLSCFQKNQFGAIQKQGRRKLMPERITVSDDFLTMLGWYVAEGWSSTAPGKGRFVGFAAHREEEWFLNKIAKYIKSEFDLDSKIYRKKDKKGIEMRVHNADFAMFMENLMGTGSREKIIPKIIMELPKRRLVSFLAAYIGGDGYSRKRQYEWTSTSPTIASQIAILLAKVGHSPALRTTSDAWIGHITVNGEPDNDSLNLIDENYVYNPIREVQTKFAKRGTRVYDIEVEDDESFVVGLATVHNCRIGQQSNKVEIVRMASNHPLDIHVLKLIESKMSLIQAAIENSVAGKIVELRAKPENEETPEQFKARMLKIMDLAQAELDRRQAIQSQNQKARGKAKVQIIHEREKDKADFSNRKILPLTENRIVAVKDAFMHMMSVCDGAHAKDNQGFNKPDASVARYLVWAGLENKTELEAAYYMLTRYHRQLSKKWPLLFKEEK